MLRIKIIVALFIILVILTACSSNENVELTQVSIEEAGDVVDFVMNYKQEEVIAVNELGFNTIESYLVTNNSFYHSLRRHMSDLQSMGTQMELVDITIEDVFYDEELTEYHIYVNEIVEVEDFQQQPTIKDDHVNYIVTNKDDRLRIVTIRSRM
ncbi:TcaA NTF2-like domain-containing protein [Desertibacillus haloalkaliphilus]|uniref:TcaA NTF2-like domain-containing protein n=1 Tax=Desertibacillus haloalkaliphilus TaxID=1328930 RepID=UPI001C27D543|nr:hypothetical protein [Desertibacillus haloalkaliphilus]MBU8907149.1 hypothetical protein [Desertibacillus haloalkaliphilus]